MTTAAKKKARGSSIPELDWFLMGESSHFQHFAVLDLMTKVTHFHGDGSGEIVNNPSIILTFRSLSGLFAVTTTKPGESTFKNGRAIPVISILSDERNTISKADVVRSPDATIELIADFNSSEFAVRFRNSITRFWNSGFNFWTMMSRLKCDPGIQFSNLFPLIRTETWC